MGFLYEVEETDTHTVIRYTRYVPGFALLILAYMLAFVLFRSPIAVAVIAGLGLVAIFRDQRAVRAIIAPAHREDRVVRSGRSLSIRNPLTFTVTKATTRPRTMQSGPRKGVQRTKRKRR